MVARHIPLRFAAAVLVLVALAVPRFAHAQDAAPLTGSVKAAVVSPATTPAPYVPRTAEELALADVQSQARIAVQALTVAMAGMKDGPELRALQARVLQTKRDAEVQFLQVKARFARNRGDLPAAQAAEDRIQLILHPRPLLATPARPQPGPDKSAAR